MIYRQGEWLALVIRRVLETNDWQVWGRSAMESAASTARNVLPVTAAAGVKFSSW
jgi:hypothetical protein